MKMELKEIKIEFEVIENMFEQLERIRKPVPFKGGLSQFPLVVGLVSKIPDSVNNLISKFVGYQSKPARQLTKIIEKMKPEIVKCMKGSDINRLCIKVHINHMRENARIRNGSIHSSFMDELRDRNITKEKTEILRLRFFRLPERYKLFITQLCNLNQRKMLNLI